MTRAAQTYTYDIPAGATVPILVSGGFYKLLEATGSVSLRREGGFIRSLLPGQGERVDFNRLEITNTSGVTNTIELLIAEDSFIDTRIYGEISIDGGKARALNGLLFTGMPNAPGVAANYPYVQIWNLASSTVNLIVQQISLGSGGPLNAAIGFGFSQRANDVTPTLMKSKMQGLPLGRAQIRWENSVTGLAQPFYNIKAPANQSTFWKPEGPIVIPPNRGLDIYNNALASDLYSTFEWYEEPI